MQKITTESGAIYYWDQDSGRLLRLGPEIPNVVHTDGQWHPVARVTNVGVGLRAQVEWLNGQVRVTSPITHMEELDG